MAIYRLEVKTHSRTGGQTNMVQAAAYRSGGRLSERDTDALAAAAYRSGSALEHGDTVHDFSRKRGVVGSEIHAPQHAPLRFQDRAALWRAVEESERRKDARLAREIIVTIPDRAYERNDLLMGWTPPDGIDVPEWRA